MIYYPTVIARYSLFVLKVSLNPKQINNYYYYYYYYCHQSTAITSGFYSTSLFFPEIASGYACSPNLWDCWCEILYTTDALPVAELTVSQHCNCNSGMDRRLRQTLRPLPKWVTLLKF